MDRAPWLVPDPWEIEEDNHSAATRRGMARTPAERAEWRRRYMRDYQRARRFGVDAEIVGWLHELACDGNHKGNRRCKPLPCYEAQP